MSQEVELISRLLPTIEDLKEMLKRVRDKHNIPDVLPEYEQLVESLSQERTVDEWEAIRKEIEDEIRAWFLSKSLVLVNTLNLFKSAIEKSPEIKSFLMNETLGVSEPVAAKFIEGVNKVANDGISAADHLFVKGSEKLLDHLITGRRITMPTEWANLVIPVRLGGETFIIAIAHQLSNPDDLSYKLYYKMIEEFGEKPEITDEDLDTAEYLAKRQSDRLTRDIVELKLKRDSSLIPYKKGTKKYNEKFKKLVVSTRQDFSRLRKDVKQILGRDKK